MNHRLAEEYVETCVADVQAVTAGLPGPGRSEELDASLFRSVSLLLRGELRRLRHHDKDSRLLPEALHGDVARWKSMQDRRELEAVVRMRASQWRTALLELLHRCETDWDQLAQGFGIDPEAGITAISEPLGDSHCGGRSVYRLSLGDGRRLIYKPRSVGPEYVFGRLVRWLAGHGCEPHLASCPILPRDGYGWAGYVASAPCRSTSEAEAYYRRQGAFLALFYLIGGSDCLDENVVVDREHPVWVDTECLCAPLVPQLAATSPVPEWFKDSVLTTHLVFWGNDMGIPARSGTGLSLRSVSDHFDVFTSERVLEDRYVEAVKSGFAALYHWVLVHRTIWSPSSGALSWWRDQRTRVILRPTMQYAALSDALLMAPPESKADCRQAVRETLQVSGSAIPWQRGVVEADLAALENGDIPYWSAVTSSRHLQEAGGTVVCNVAETTGTECLEDRAACMSEAELNNQLFLIDTFLRLPEHVQD